jgi:hypothetical protein
MRVAKDRAKLREVGGAYVHELDGPAVSTLKPAIADIKQRWSVIGWVTKNLLSQAPPCFGKHVKPLIPVVFAVVSTH